MNKLEKAVYNGRKERKRCSGLVKELYAELNTEFESNFTCNACGNEEIAIISDHDRYGLKVRAGLCLNCGLIFLVDHPTTSGYQVFYERFYRRFITAYHNREENLGRIQREQFRFANRLISTLEGLPPFSNISHFLDVGGSTGVIASVFREKIGGKGTVLDPSSKELKRASDQGHDVIHSLFETWEPNPSDQFDLVMCFRTIDHFMNLVDSLIKMRTVLNEKGHLIIDIIDFNMILRSNQVLQRAIKTDHLYYLTLETAHRIFKSVGFNPKILEIASHHERVTFVCTKCEPEEIQVTGALPYLWNAKDLQSRQLDSALVTRHITLWEKIHYSMYKLKQRTLQGVNRNA